METLYDVIVIGAGVIGSSVARYLSRFEGKFLVVERHNDVGEETTNANSAIVHSGYDPLPGTKKAYFNVKGNKMMEQVCKELEVPYRKNGSLTVAFNDEEVETLHMLKERAKENGVKAEILTHDELMKEEPNINDEAIEALLCEDGAIVSPFNLCVSFMENAMDNGVELLLNNEVIKINKLDNEYEIITSTGLKLHSKAIVNASGLRSDEVCAFLEKPNFEVIPRKGQYILLDHFDNDWIKHTLFMVPTKVGKGVLISPTTSTNYIVGPTNDDSSKTDTSTDADTLNEIKRVASKLCKNVPYFENIRQFAGVRANSSTGDFIIEESKINKNFFNLGGIMSPGLASSPAIGEYVSDLVKESLSLKLNKNYNPRIRHHFRMSEMNPSDFNELVKKDPRYGHMVCRCEKVSEGEIVDAINRNCGARTVKGVKKRVRAGFGKCQGTFCQNEVIKIIARETGRNKTEICYSDLNTEVEKYKVKGE